MNIMYIGKFRYTPMTTSQNSVRNVSVATDEGPGSKLALMLNHKDSDDNNFLEYSELTN